MLSQTIVKRSRWFTKDYSTDLDHIANWEIVFFLGYQLRLVIIIQYMIHTIHFNAETSISLQTNMYNSWLFRLNRRSLHFDDWKREAAIIICWVRSFYNRFDEKWWKSVITILEILWLVQWLTCNHLFRNARGLCHRSSVTVIYLCVSKIRVQLDCVFVAGCMFN